jgi:biotin carboxyl carrier protein
MNRTASPEALDEIRASMPGVVVAVQCESGQAVKTGDKLLTLESMKLQMTIVALRDATVQQVHVTPAAVFERGALLVSLVPEESRAS